MMSFYYYLNCFLLLMPFVFAQTQSPGSSITLYDTPFTTNPLDVTNWGYDYSYDMHPPNGSTLYANNGGVNPNYFSILPSPDGITNAIRVQLFPTDLLFSNSTAITITCPRSEISGSRGAFGIPFPLFNGNTYVSQWYMYIENYSIGYNFAFAQVHALGPANLILRFESGAYILTISQGKQVVQLNRANLAVSPDLREDIGRWISWRMEFSLMDAGFVRVYKDSYFVGEFMGNTTGLTFTQFWKFGVYSQPSGTTCTKPSPSGPATVWFRDFVLYQGLNGLPIVPEYPTLSFDPTNPPTTTVTYAAIQKIVNAGGDRLFVSSSILLLCSLLGFLGIMV